jgi:hypothetical protein
MASEESSVRKEDPGCSLRGGVDAMRLTDEEARRKDHQLLEGRVIISLSPTPGVELKSRTT